MNSTGHMVLLEAAYKLMTPQAQAWLTQTLSDPNNPEDGNFTEPSDTVVPSAATEPDDYKSWARRTHNGDDPKSYDHFYNNPVGDPQYTAGHPAASPNGVTQIEQQIAILKNSDSSADEKADALRWVCHEYGDIGAQPWHVATLFNAQFPNGDAGGNDFKLSWGSTGRYDTDLHALADAGGAHPDPNDPDKSQNNFKYLKEPLSQGDLSWISNTADNILQANPQSSFTDAQLNDQNPMDWVHDLSDEAAQMYGQFNVGETLSPNDPRLAQMETMMDRNVALAAYRLANLCDALSSSSGAAAMTAARVPPHAPLPRPPTIIARLGLPDTGFAPTVRNA